MQAEASAAQHKLLYFFKSEAIIIIWGILWTSLQCLYFASRGRASVIQQLGLSSSNMASSLPASAAASLGGTCVGLPAVGHFRRARVSFYSAFKLSCRTWAAATFKSVVWQKIPRSASKEATPDFLTGNGRNICLLWRHLICLCFGEREHSNNNGGGALTAARCIISGSPLLALGWIAVMFRMNGSI